MMEYSDHTKALLLLTSHLGRPLPKGQNLLTLREWNQLRTWLEREEYSPQDLLHDVEIIQDWEAKAKNKVVYLLDRGLALAEASLRWQQAGIWIVSYSEEDFPQRISTRINATLPYQIPPLFFGIGNRSYIQGGGIAVVGSRNAPPEDLEYTRQFGGVAAYNEVMIVSGGAKCVDITAMNGCLESGGKVIGVLSDKLLRRSMERTCRDYIENDQLLLLSATDPDVRLSRFEFSKAAMERNKYIYCLSDAAVVVRSGTKGGTISGAKENIKHSWVPLWVKSTEDMDTGNEEISSKKGAHRLANHENAEDHLHSILRVQQSHNSDRSSTNVSHEMLRRAIVLLTTHLNGEESDLVEPMDTKDWKEIVQILRSSNMTPAHLLDNSLNETLNNGDFDDVQRQRIKHLLDKNRQSILSHKFKDWKDEKIDVWTRADPDYPKGLKNKLRYSSPPVLFVVGSKDLLSSPELSKIMVIGSVKQQGSDQEYAELLGTSLAQQQVILSSTYTSQMEKVVVKSSLNNGGKCILVLNDKFKHALDDSSFEKGIAEGRMIILSLSPPQSKSNASTDDCYNIACCLSSSIIVLRSGKRDAVARCVNRSIQGQWTPIYRRPMTSMPMNLLFSQDHYEHVLVGKNAQNHLKTILNNDRS